ncbi:MAG: hypothetical protein J6V09_00680 [Clostridia bacterium]|nr:hypothetical protein [Clostridia bacterium]
MYTRTYFPEDEKINIPERYNGNAFDTQTQEDAAAEKTEEVIARKSDEDGGIFGLLTRLGGGLFPEVKKIGKDFHIGREELIIIGIALFLLFSSGGDKECAIMLLILLIFK